MNELEPVPATGFALSVASVDSPQSVLTSERACRFCGKTFTPNKRTAHKQVFCCRKCNDSAREQRRKEKHHAFILAKHKRCKTCGKIFAQSFVPRNGQEILYCSEECKKTARNKQSLNCHAKRAARGESFAQLLRKQALEKLGGKCVRCGFSDIRALQIDHVRGDGYLENRRRISQAYVSPYKYLKKVLADTNGSYQCLCANCNWIKRQENGETGTKRNPRRKSTGAVPMLDSVMR